VTEEGDIIYVFPELQVSASTPGRSQVDATSITLKRAGLSPDASAGEIKTLLNMNGISTRGALEKRELVSILQKALPPMTRDEEEELLGGDATLLQEQEYKFSVAPEGNRFLAAGLGVVNLLGALYLGGQLNYLAAYGYKLPAFFGFVQSIYPLLFSYAVLFNVIPFVRSFWIKQQNSEIQSRNQRRRLWKTALESGVGRTQRKLLAARRFGTKLKRIGSRDIFFDTSKPIEDTEQKRQQDALDDFDKLLGN
jgi:hypothetical protein